MLPFTNTNNTSFKEFTRSKKMTMHVSLVDRNFLGTDDKHDLPTRQTLGSVNFITNFRYTHGGARAVPRIYLFGDMLPAETLGNREHAVTREQITDNGKYTFFIWKDGAFINVAVVSPLGKEFRFNDINSISLLGTEELKRRGYDISLLDHDGYPICLGEKGFSRF